MTAPQRIVVVGASVAGIAAAESLRRLGHEGEIVLLGGEGHRPYDRPPLTKSVLSGAQAPEDNALRPHEWHADHGIDLRLGAPAAALDLEDRAVLLASGERVGFDGLVIATGAIPRVLPGAPLEGVFTVRTLDDALGLQAAIRPGSRVVVVGGGFIGAEVAATARQLGAEATIVEVEDVPLARSLGPTMGALLGQVHADAGVVLRCGVPVAGMDGEGRVERVRLADGSAIEADVVVVGLGVRPATAWLESSGLRLDDGVVCDASCRTSAPGVVAAGDVARWAHPELGTVRIEHWENAVSMGRAAAATLLDHESAAPYDPVPYVWSDQYEHKIQVVGRRHPDDALVVVNGSLDDRKFLALYTRGEQVTAAISFNRPAAIMKVRRALRGGATVAEVEAALSAGKRPPQTVAP